MGFLEQLFMHPVSGGFGFLSIIAINIWAIRLIRAFQQETRDDYSKRLHEKIFELEAEKRRVAVLEDQLRALNKAKE